MSANNITHQSFVIHRHGARYPLQRPSHNVAWPQEKSFWESHLGRLTPVGVIQMSQVGVYFKLRYPWIQNHNCFVWSTHRSRALESAWALLLGLLPEAAIKFNCIRTNECGTSTSTHNIKIDDSNIKNEDNTCYINYYHKKSDTLFGQEDPSRVYKVNVNDSRLLQEYSQNPIVQTLVERLSSKGHFRIRRDPVTTIAKLKEIYSQLIIDNQLQISDKDSLVNHYGLTEIELQLINDIGCEVMCRRLIPSTDLIEDDVYNQDQGKGLLQDIYNKINNWSGNNELNIYSCHDTNMIAVMSNLGLKIPPPSFAGYILIERTISDNIDSINVYYSIDPFGPIESFDSKTWPSTINRTHFLNWDDLSNGSFTNESFKQVLYQAIN